MLAPGAARAACDPNPTQPGVITTCTGLDSTGVLVATSASTVTIDASAIVQTSGPDAIYVTSNTPTSSPFSNYSTIQVDGKLVGTSANAIHVRSGALLPGQYPYQTLQSSITIGATGVVAGVTGITLSSDVSNSLAQTTASIVNAGTISGTSGVALLGGDPAQTYFRRLIT